MTTKTTYLVFLQNTQTGEEFTAPTNAPTGAYEIAMGQLRQQYPAPKFKVHTAYTQAELETALNGLSRWPGLSSKVQAGTVKVSNTRTAPVRVTLGEAARQATGATIQRTTEAPIQQPQQTAPAQTTQTQPTQQAEQAPTVAPAAMAQQGGISVIEHLKAMRKA